MGMILFGLLNFLVVLLEYPCNINLLNLCFHITLMHIAKLAEIIGKLEKLLNKKAYKKSFFADYSKKGKTPLNFSSSYSSFSLHFLARQVRQHYTLFSVNLLQNFSLGFQRNCGYFNSVSTLAGNGKPSTDFLEWFAGLTDGEGTFYIRRRSAKTPVYSFKFSIGTHIDDIGMLHFIQDTLGMGKVFTSGNVAQYEVYDLKNIPKIINIFTQHPLRTTKLLNFLDFKRAYELYKGPTRSSSEVVQEIANLKEGMNTTRTNFEMPKGYQPLITPYWLLGFVEGEASFNVIKGYYLTFSLAQSSIDYALMVAIKNFFNSLPIDGDGDVVYLGTFMGTAGKEVTRITISQNSYIRSVLIPLFEGLVWHSKKYLDFQDWVKILELRDRCHQYGEEGKELMDQIVSQMNNNRLSTNKAPRVDRALLYTSVNKLLNGPSNCEIRDGKVWIKSLNRFRHKGGLIKPLAVQLQDQKGNIIKTFDTQVDCAKCLGVSRTTVARWLREGKPTLFEGRIVFITSIEEKEEE